MASIEPKPLPSSIERMINLTIRRSKPPGDRVAWLCHVSDVSLFPGQLKGRVVTAGGIKTSTDENDHLWEGQLVVVFKVGAFLPADDHPVFEALPNQSVLNGERGFLVDHFMDRGLFSKGLILPAMDFPEIDELLEDLTDFYGGCRTMAEIDLCILDIEALLGVKRWDPRAKNTAEGSLGPVPKFFKKPKIPRLKECPNLFRKEKYRTLIYQETEKLDGSTMAVYFISKSSPFYDTLNPLPKVVGEHTVLSNGRVGVCSVNNEINEKTAEQPFVPFWKAVIQQNLPAILNELNQDIVLQGELIGWNVNGNRHKYAIGKYDMFVFDIWEPRLEKNWLNAREVVKWCKKNEVQHVPVRGYFTIREIAESHDDLQDRADDLHVRGEGLVYKCVQRPDRRFKVHNRHYLEKYGLE